MNYSVEINATKTSGWVQHIPKISIVVPNFNGGKTIEATLKSIINQNYPHLEIIVIDGGSTDNSIDIIKKYESQITYWISEKDSGQSNAINKGFAKCSGEIANWLCSDDLLTEDALSTVARNFASSPNIDVLVGRSEIIFTSEKIAQSNSREINYWLTLLTRIFNLEKRSIILDAQDKYKYIKAPTSKQLELISVQNPIPQPSCFYRRKLLNRTQPIDESYEYAMDTELWNYFHSQGARWKCIDDILSVCIQDGQNKSSTGGYKITIELERIYKTYVKEWIPLTFWHRKFRYPLERVMALNSRKLWIYTAAPIWIILTLLLAPFYGLEKVWAMRWKRWV